MVLVTDRPPVGQGARVAAILPLSGATMAAQGTRLAEALSG
jgi:hypothetical protein